MIGGKPRVHRLYFWTEKEFNKNPPTSSLSVAQSTWWDAHNLYWSGRASWGICKNFLYYLTVSNLTVSFFCFVLIQRFCIHMHSSKMANRKSSLKQMAGETWSKSILFWIEHCFSQGLISVSLFFACEALFCVRNLSCAAYLASWSQLYWEPHIFVLYL